MHRKLSIFIAGVVYLAIPSVVYAEDYCNQAFVSGLLISFEAEDDFKTCNLQGMVSAHAFSAEVLIELLSSLLDDYEEASNTDNGHDDSSDESSATNTEAVQPDLESPLTLVRTGKDIDLDADRGLDKLKNWAAAAISSIESQKNDIISLQHSSSTEIKQLQCEAKYQWRKLHASRNRILICVGKLENTGSD